MFRSSSLRLPLRWQLRFVLRITMRPACYFVSALDNLLARRHSVGMAKAPSDDTSSHTPRPASARSPRPDPSERLSGFLADNIRQLREARGLTQQQLAKLAGVPRPTWANLESGAANPTIAVLVKVASALQVSVEELLSPPRVAARFFPADRLTVRKRGLVTVRKLLPEPLPSLELDRLELPPGGQMTGVPHTPGTREYLTCERGCVELSASGQSWQLRPGDVVVFRGDQKHSYRNPAREPAVAYSVVVLSPSSPLP
jgi:transcriptional regulator with XRE-family HTH domain